mmetsp:Transcript_2535/g.5064  ORF Transcript_2535/g.5064 Transcript_2535/m.5064 type:complete len:345 (+) Transcript_2535:1125-2159(+)
MRFRHQAGGCLLRGDVRGRTLWLDKGSGRGRLAFLGFGLVVVGEGEGVVALRKQRVWARQRHNLLVGRTLECRKLRRALLRLLHISSLNLRFRVSICLRLRQGGRLGGWGGGAARRGRGMRRRCGSFSGQHRLRHGAGPRRLLCAHDGATWRHDGARAGACGVRVGRGWSVLLWHRIGLALHALLPASLRGLFPGFRSLLARLLLSHRRFRRTAALGCVLRATRVRGGLALGVAMRRRASCIAARVARGQARARLATRGGLQPGRALPHQLLVKKEPLPELRIALQRPRHARGVAGIAGGVPAAQQLHLRLLRVLELRHERRRAGGLAAGGVASLLRRKLGVRL